MSSSSGPRNDRTLTFGWLPELRRTACETPYVLTFDDTAGSPAWPNDLRSVLTRAARYANSAQPGEILVIGGRLSDERLLCHSRWACGEIPRAICLVPDAFTAGCLRQKITAIGESVALEVQRAPLDTEAARIVASVRSISSCRHSPSRFWRRRSSRSQLP